MNAISRPVSLPDLRAAADVLERLAQQGVHPHGISADSRCIGQGDVFAAMPGVRGDGRAFIQDAVARGAGAVVWESEAAPPLALELPNVPVTHLSDIAGDIAHLIYGRPSGKLWMCGVTGTNGKTSVSQWIAQAFARLERRCAVIGTLGSGFPGTLKETANTTPDVISIHSALAGFLASGAEACAMEVSSIGLDQGRTDAVAFDVAVFTNLTRDHLEYHGSMDAYGAAKARLFAVPGLKAAVINLDDAFGRRLARDLAGSGVRRIGYTLDAASTGKLVESVDELLAARDIAVTGTGLAFTATAPQGAAAFASCLLGRFNVSNLLAVMGALLAAGLPLERIAAVVPHLVPPPGRMEMVFPVDGNRADLPLIVVDYAHTPDALEQALTTLREVATSRGGKLICVFGCGGDRDPGKRPLMGRVVEGLADVCAITSDNPRSEDPNAIVAGIVAGMKAAALVETDRATAIHRMVVGADRRDVVLIAGKGHEPYQEIAGQRLPFSDVEQVRAALAAWRTKRC